LRATQHDVLETFRPFVKNTKLFLNTGLTVEEGEQLIEAGKIDGIFIGFNWITHPDLLKRVLHGKPLNNIPDIQHLQTKTEAGDWSVGYTDYPTADYGESEQ
jgi:2,4-dienoyl-CoA reductase-like NADH-dependent reductase (Old Yellow Enzyme family)